MLKWIRIVFGLKFRRSDEVLNNSKNLQVYVVKGMGTRYRVYTEVEDVEGLSIGWLTYRALNRTRVLGFKYSPSKYYVDVLSYHSLEAVNERFPPVGR